MNTSGGFEAGSLPDQQELRLRLEDVQERIAHAAISAGREPGSVELVVVTKAQPVELIRAAIGAGARNLGENYADQALPKIEALSDFPHVTWHMIGHIQSRKAALVSEHFGFVHSLDSVKIANRLSRFAGQAGRKLPCLLEYNVSGEESKYGWAAEAESRWDSLLPELEKVLALPHLEVRGLMTIAPFLPDPEESRPFFRRLRKLRQYLAAQFPHVDWSELSMGMSADFTVAVEEGATIVRIGQAILGPRPG
jgi:pyridoxal phosphate enzyme (YggS family)